MSSSRFTRYPGSYIRGFGFGRDRQMQGEGAALPWFRSHGDAAAQFVHDAMHQAQPQAAAMDLAGNRIRSPIERLEDVRQVAGGNARPVVLHGDLDILSAGRQRL